MTKELEALERIDDYVDKDYDYCQRGYYRKDYKLIKQALLKAQEQEKVLKLLFEKQVDIHLLKACMTCYVDSLNAYNSEIKKLYSKHKDYQNKPLSFYLLTPDEFELLKRYYNEKDKSEQ